LKHIEKSIGAEHQPSIYSQFIGEIFDIVSSIGPQASDFSEEASRQIGKPWQTHRDEILALEVELYLAEGSRRIQADPVLKQRAEEISKKYRQRLSTVLPGYPD
jgi:hypothetical protein